jgi:hypothetical protein
VRYHSVGRVIMLNTLVAQHLTGQRSPEPPGAQVVTARYSVTASSNFLHALILQCRAAEHRNEFPFDRGFTQAALELLEAEFFTLEIRAGSVRHRFRRSVSTRSLRAFLGRFAHLSRDIGNLPLAPEIIGPDTSSHAFRADR